MNLLVIGVPFAALILSNAFASAAIFNGVLQLTIFIVTAMIPGKLVVHLHKIKSNSSELKMYVEKGLPG